ncbi:hypothetical protein [Xaviernesmea oryzae]|uniref:DUF680 domain-containing protein n=1 Tax=Xaviernesmea oryzae TaxID=464029 RepID=A0A1X7DQ94_9HYPH|nr:hypothetical protein [Xaviernesmea oryzae]SMF19224.1 hypothetical protein SAMN02982989_5676 [Xaviernesmea oryzae]
MKTSISAIAAMVMAASFSGSALAEGDYYEGVSKAPITTSARSAKVDSVKTGSIEQVRADDRRDGPIFKHESRDNR